MAYLRVILLVFLSSILTYLGVRHYLDVEFTDVIALVMAVYLTIFGAVYEAIH